MRNFNRFGNFFPRSATFRASAEQNLRQKWRSEFLFIIKNEKILQKGVAKRKKV
jgi:hypothetical protein